MRICCFFNISVSVLSRIGGTDRLYHGSREISSALQIQEYEFRIGCVAVRTQCVN